MSEPIIEVKNLARDFGEVKAVNGVSFEIAAGTIAGFIGANGAGKTTTMRMMVTLERPSAG
ncbi:MAG TPA: ATP-binding cassette domain-containing protein, partial [Terrimicrobiaceae bacterium]